MRTRVRPTQIEVPTDFPFKYDLLDRRPAIETLSDMLGGIEGPCVVALDSEWGGGKSTFLRIWAAHLEIEGYVVAKFNAWETDFSGDPFVALSSHLEEHLLDDSAQNAAERAERFTKAAKEVALRAIPSLLRIATSGLVDLGALGEEIGAQVASFAENRLNEYREGQESINNFRRVLEEEALALSERHQNRPLFVMIDELDRCRPSYAVELLEVAKHLFSVDRMIFVLAINRSELAHAVKALYGVDFDADRYLLRFFDLDYNLPKPDQANFVLQGIRNAKLEELFQDSNDPLSMVPEMIKFLLTHSELDLRRIEQNLNRLSLILSSTNELAPSTVASIAVTLVLRTIDPELYFEFRDSTSSDLDFVQKIYNLGGLCNLVGKPVGNLLEAMIVAGHAELSGVESGIGFREKNSKVLSLHESTLKERESILESYHQSGQVPNVSEKDKARFKRADNVLETFRFLIQKHSYKLGFIAAVHRVELLPIDT